MARCETPGCNRYGRDLQEDEYEFVARMGVYVCTSCWGSVADPPPPPSTDARLPLSSTAEAVPASPPPEIPAIHTPVAPTLELQMPEPDAEPYWSTPVESLPPEAEATFEPKPSLLDDIPGPDWGSEVKVRPWFPSQAAAPQTALPSGVLDEGTEAARFELKGAQVFPAVIVYQGGKARSRHEIRGDSFVIGRASSHSLELPHLDFGTYTDGKRVSRRHARIFQRDGQYWVEDLGSEHGTWLNGEWLQPNVPKTLQDDDTIGVGGVADLEWRMPDDRWPGREAEDKEDNDG